MKNDYVENDIVFCTTKALVKDPKIGLTYGQLSYLITKSESNGLAPALRRLGKKIYVRKDLFIKWLENQSYFKWTFETHGSDKKDNIESISFLEEKCRLNPKLNKGIYSRENP